MSTEIIKIMAFFVSILFVLLGIFTEDKEQGRNVILAAMAIALLYMMIGETLP